MELARAIFSQIMIIDCIKTPKAYISSPSRLNPYNFRQLFAEYEVDGKKRSLLISDVLYQLYLPNIEDAGAELLIASNLEMLEMYRDREVRDIVLKKAKDIVSASLIKKGFHCPVKYSPAFFNISEEEVVEALKKNPESKRILQEIQETEEKYNQILDKTKKDRKGFHIDEYNYKPKNR